MSQIVLLSGSPSASSRSTALLDRVRSQLEAAGFSTVTFSVRDFPAEDLVLARYASPAFVPVQEAIAKSVGVVVATPVYKAAYAGGLKALLDVLPQTALRGKTVLALATGGSPAHQLAIDYALKPVLSALGATDLLQGVYAVDGQFTPESSGLRIAPELLERLDQSVEHLVDSARAIGV